MTLKHNANKNGDFISSVQKFRLPKIASFQKERTKIVAASFPTASHFRAYDRRKWKRKVLVFCHGASDGDPGPGAWAVILVDGQGVYEAAGALPVATDNLMELFAVHYALHALPEPREVLLFTDSDYVQKIMSRGLEEWKPSGWRPAGETQVLCKFLAAAAAKHHITCQAVPADPDYERMNERCDMLTSSQILTVLERLTRDDIPSLRESFINHHRKLAEQDSSPDLDAINTELQMLDTLRTNPPLELNLPE